MSQSRHQNSIFRFPKLFSNKKWLTYALVLFVSSGMASAASQQGASPDMQKIKKLMQEQIALMKPELQKKVKALSPQTKKSLLMIYAKHNRHSDKLTLRQVMHEVLADYESMVTGIVTDNGEQAADSARRLANHRIPRGGLLPYLSMDKINDKSLAVLEVFNDSVEGKAKQLAEAAERGDMAQAASYLSEITGGCIGCHGIFRGVPGQSSLLR